MRIGYLECFSGICGDMLLGALVDAGVSFDELEKATAALKVGARLEMRKVSRGGIAATKVDVVVADDAAHEHSNSHQHEAQTHRAQPHDEHLHHPHSHASGAHEHVARIEHSHTPHRSLSAILAIIQAAPLNDAVKSRAALAFELLGDAEARIHAVPIETVHFHEVGAVDTIVDIVCAAAGCEALGVDRWISSPLNVGSGTVDCQHGTLPVPAPAALALLADAPVYAAGVPMERVTPTGAALLRMLDVRYEPFPAMRIVSSGYGAGERENPGEPNFLRLLVGETIADPQAERTASDELQSIAVIETVIDDSSPQLLGYVSDLLLAAGAWDVYRIPVQMKKGRTGIQLTVLCNPDLVGALRDRIFRETTTIGLHWRIENKAALAREFSIVTTPWGDVHIKIARWPSGKIANASPEYEDCRRIAVEYKLPLKHVLQEAMRIYLAGNAVKEGNCKEESGKDAKDPCKEEN